MKLAVIKLGARIAHGGTSGGSGEALAILDILSHNHNVHAYTKILDKDRPIKNVTLHQISDEHNDINMDALVIINGAVNYFGGADSPDQTLNYHVINNFNGPVFYILCDPALPLRQVWPSISKKEWSENYLRDNIEIQRTDIIYISQPKNVNKIHKDLQKNVQFKKCVHFPFEKFPLRDKPLEFNKLSDRTYDLLYGGTFRGGKRQDDMIKFYFDMDEYNVAMFGKIKEKDFNVKKIAGKSHPKYENAVKYQDFNNKMSTSIATVIIGDKYYKETDDLAQRIYESILSGVVTFIDSDYDKYKRVYTDERLKKFLYVNNSEDVKKRLDIIKNLDEASFSNLLNSQYEDVKINYDNYCLQLSEILENEI